MTIRIAYDADGYFTGVKSIASRVQALDTLAAIKSTMDKEDGHVAADEVLCKLLEHLGYADVAAAFHSIDKWYA